MSETTNEGYDCRRCGRALSAERPDKSTVTYYRCTGCGQMTSDLDREAFNRAARRNDARADASETAQLAEWCRRLEAFQVRAAETDPFARLGLPPNATLADARNRFHTLAMDHHPDRSGDAQALAELVDAFDRIRDRFAQGRELRTVRERPPTSTKRQPASWARAAAKR